MVIVRGGNMSNDILMLGIESSCDETAAAVVRNGREVLSNIISSQIDIHTLYGGVVPEIASRKHIERINYVIEEALKKANEYYSKNAKPGSMAAKAGMVKEYNEKIQMEKYRHELSNSDNYNSKLELAQKLVSYKISSEE